MIRSFTVENFKSIDKLTMELGRFNVLIGENGSGKSNVLEALVVACFPDGSATELAIRGVRFVAPFMPPRFDANAEKITRVACDSENMTWSYAQGWSPLGATSVAQQGVARLAETIANEVRAGASSPERIRELLGALSWMRLGTRPTFAIFAPENSALRSYQTETQLLPLGIRGEGLFAHLRSLADGVTGRELIAEIVRGLAAFDWFERAELPSDLGPGEQRISIFDRYLAKGALFDQRSANEGFLFALFYFTLLVSPDSPPFFAIDNVDTSFNPRLCVRIVKELIKLAEVHKKQVVVTTHNPSVLDALDLSDDEQRLFVISRTSDGATRARRIPQPKPVGDQPVVPLSEAFLRGYLGGLPTNF